MPSFSPRAQLAVLAFLLVMAALCTVNWAWILVGPGCRIPPFKVAEYDAHEVRSAVTRWRGLRSGHECPDTAQLVLDGQIDPASKLTDPWGKPYWIRCLASGDDVVVSSAGPDGLDGNSDDIVVPKGWATSSPLSP